MSNTPKPHPHAELIKAWADGAKIQMLINGEWHDRRSDKMEWLDDEQYRIKPEENAPWKPKDKESFHYLSGDLQVYRIVWTDTTYDNNLLDVGNYFRTRAEAQAAAERVKATLKGDNIGSELDLNALADKMTELERENKDLKIRNENLHKAKEILIAKQPELDGKPLTNGEKALIRAYRNPANAICVCGDDDNEVIRALKQIQAEQEAQNEAE